MINRSQLLLQNPFHCIRPHYRGYVITKTSTTERTRFFSSEL